MILLMGQNMDLGLGIGYLPITYAIALCVVFVIERILHSFVWLCVSLARFPHLSGPESMVSVCQGVLMGGINLYMEMIRIWISALGGLAQWMLYYVPMICIFLFCIWLMSIFSATQAGLVRDLLIMWNDGTSQQIRKILIVPLQLLNLIYEIMVPFWNAFIFFGKGLVFDVIVPMLKVNIDPILKAVTSASNVIQSVGEGSVSFVQSLSVCNDQSCLSPGSRVFDFLSPMIHVRMFISYSLIFSRDTCGVLRPVLDLMAYPFLDSNAGLALHSGLNSLLYAVVQLPLVTVARCNQAANDTDARMKAIACTPDVAPVFNLASASVRYAGILVDNWLDVTWITILSAFGKAPDVCAASPAAFTNIAEQQLFGGNETRMIGLGGTSYALTDGNSVQYTFFRGKPEYVSATQPCKSHNVVEFLIVNTESGSCVFLCLLLLKVHTKEPKI
jgi:hypothetical protein